MMTRSKQFGLVCSLALTALLGGCGGDMDDLLAYIDEVKSRPGGRIEPLPQIKPYETFSYSAANLRSPFLPDERPRRAVASGPRPIVDRPKEFLEQFPLDTLEMVGALEINGKTYALVQTPDKLVHRVLPGNYVGQNEGRIVEITESEIRVEELVPDGMGGFFKRSAAISLD